MQYHRDTRFVGFDGLMQMGLVISTAIPVVAFALLGLASLSIDRTTLLLVIVFCAIIVLFGVLIVNYFVQRAIKTQLMKIVDAGQEYAKGNHSVRAEVIGDESLDVLAMLAKTLNTIFERRGDVMEEKTLPLDERHQVRVYRSASHVILQVQREIPPEDDPLGTSFRVAVALSPDEAADLAAELTKR